jgi:hypothetical protein
MILLYGCQIKESHLCLTLDTIGLLFSAALCLRVGCFFNGGFLRMFAVPFLSFIFLGTLLIFMTDFFQRPKFFSLQSVGHSASIALGSQILMLPVLEMCGCSNILMFFMTGFFFTTLFFLFSQAVINLCTSADES